MAHVALRMNILATKQQGEQVDVLPSKNQALCVS